MTNLLKAAKNFQKLSQDPMVPIRVAIETALAKWIDDGVFAISNISLIDNEVKINIHVYLRPGRRTADPDLLSWLQKFLSTTVSKVNPALKTTVTIDMSSEGAIPSKATASLRERFARFHKLAECAKGDPLCDDLNSGLKPDEAQKFPPKPTPKPTQKPADINKADDSSSEIRAAINSVLQNFPGTKLLELIGTGARLDAKIEVPEKHSFTATQLGVTLTDKVNEISPGHQVIAVLSYSTNK